MINPTGKLQAHPLNSASRKHFRQLGKHPYKSETLEHLGLVAGMFDELGIGELVDELVAQDLEQRKISVGQPLRAMVLNGLGFANRRLYLTTRFFQNKPTGRLLGEGIEPEHLNDDALGKALDDLYDYSVSKLYMKIAGSNGIVRHEVALFE